MALRIGNKMDGNKGVFAAILFYKPSKETKGGQNYAGISNPPMPGIRFPPNIQSGMAPQHAYEAMHQQPPPRNQPPTPRKSTNILAHGPGCMQGNLVRKRLTFGLYT